MSKGIKKVTVKVPHRISGFFEIVDKINGKEIQDPEKIGSRGAGFCVNAAGETEIVIGPINKDSEIHTEIYINGNEMHQNAETTYFIVDYIRNYLKKPWKISVYHSFDLPVGCGYGASGSGALGTIFGLDYLLKLNLSFQEKGKIAHIAEVVNRTGLGTVCGQLNGGMGILKEAGFPCIYERIALPDDLKVVCGCFGAIHTKSILTDPVLSLKIKEAGKKSLQILVKNPSVKTFINESIEFVERTNILEILELSKVKNLIIELNKLNIFGASMNQLGRSVYALCRKKNEKDVIEVLESYKPEIQIYSTSVYNRKNEFIKNNI